MIIINLITGFVNTRKDYSEEPIKLLKSFLRVVKIRGFSQILIKYSESEIVLIFLGVYLHGRFQSPILKSEEIFAQDLMRNLSRFWNN
jgi:hypothetical protein